jgi:uncharacterized RDD family membrane protein YckC
MFCSSCGATVPDGTAFCGSCGRPIVGYSISQSSAASPAGAAAMPAAGVIAPAGTAIYAGFWLRFVAYLIDSAIIWVAAGIIIALIVGIVGIGFFRNFAGQMNTPNPVFPAALLTLIFLFAGVLIIATWLYFAGMESSETQGTLGKMALALIVTDMKGNRISFGRASGRFFAKIITGMVPLAIGYIMAGFTEKKQALHDMIASCLVMRKS